MNRWRIIAGVDEAGRGSLFGPLVAAAVILDPERIPQGIKDSKKLSAKMREKLFTEIISSSISWSFSLATVEEIERENVLRATMLAMKRSLLALTPEPTIALIDGPFTPDGLEFEAKPLIGGDRISPPISAASILAKVIRDRIIIKMSFLFPDYHLEKNKGYATQEHRKLVMEWGNTPFHRDTFGLKYKRGEE